MAEMTHDRAAVAAAQMDLVFEFKGGADSREGAMQMPGCGVKSKETQSSSSWPKWFAKVVEFTNEKVTLCSYRGDETIFVWTGNSSEYYSMWDCD